MEFIKFLEQELEQQTPEIRLNMITALGKLGMYQLKYQNFRSGGWTELSGCAIVTVGLKYALFLPQILQST